MTITKEALQEHDAYNQRALFSVLSMWGLPASMLDIGSGSGIMTRTARNLGIHARGIDLLAEPPDVTHNLDNGPIFLGQTFDLIVTIETAEHIANEQAFLQTIQNHTHKGSLLIFTAAVPGQLGDGHVNCQPKEHWKNKLTNMGYTYDPQSTQLIGEWWRWSAGGLSAWLTPNLQIFKYGWE